MTEAEWLVSDDPDEMYVAVERGASARKMRLFGVACCRRVWNLMTDPEHRAAVEASEKFADGLIDEAALDGAFVPVGETVRESSTEWTVHRWMASAVQHVWGSDAAGWAASFAARGRAASCGPEGCPEWDAANRAEESAQCHLLRDIFGNGFLPFRFNPGWLSGDGRAATDLAGEVYATQDFGRLPELGDALERAGCAARDAIEHCRSPGPHVRGCWVVDALLGRECVSRPGLLTLGDWMGHPDPGPFLHILRGKGNVRKWRLFAVACCRRIDHLITDGRSRRAVEAAVRHADGAATDAELEAARDAAHSVAEAARHEEVMARLDAEGEAFSMYLAYLTASIRYHSAEAAFRAGDNEVGPAPYGIELHPRSHNQAAEAASSAALANFENEHDHDPSGKACRAAEAARLRECRAQVEMLCDLFGDYLGSPGSMGGWVPMGQFMGGERWCLLPTRRRVEVRPEWLAWNGGAASRLARHAYDAEAFDTLPILADALEEAGCTDADILAHLRSPGFHVRGCWVLDAILGKE